MADPAITERLTAVRAAISDMAAGQRIKSYTINGRTVVRADLTLTELIALEKSLVQQESAQNVSSSTGGRAYVSFGEDR